MIPGVCARLAVLFVMLAAWAGCGGSPKTIPCRQSIADACAASGNCVFTWAEVEADGRICALPSVTTPLGAECGAYHAVTIAHADANTTYYYDRSSEMLVAIVLSTGTNGTTTCVAGPSGPGPSGGFAPPSCTGAASEPLARCLDGGTD
jgi:hypothetical protein